MLQRYWKYAHGGTRLVKVASPAGAYRVRIRQMSYARCAYVYIKGATDVTATGKIVERRKVPSELCEPVLFSSEIFREIPWTVPEVLTKIFPRKIRGTAWETVRNFLREDSRDTDQKVLSGFAKIPGPPRFLP